MAVDVHLGNYRFECVACGTPEDIRAPSLDWATRAARAAGWRLGWGRNKFRDACPECADAPTGTARDLEPGRDVPTPD